jgi:NADPH:quinone reductase-like Zn-dependent oxidoreductase
LVLHGGGSPGHVFGPVAGILRAVVASAFVSQRLRPLPSRQNREELLAVTGLIEDGKLMPVVGRTYSLAETVEGLRAVEQGHARGKVVVTVACDRPGA